MTIPERANRLIFMNIINMQEQPLVSIQCLVYNHESYLRQCLDSFVMQKTNFKFEAIVHDDVSTDGSAAIIREYAEKYPDIIKPIFETENQYSKHDGSLNRIMHEACKGKYIALCEGDDYWIDPLKLQKQVDILESSEEYSLCMHAHTELYSNGDSKDIFRYESDNYNVPMVDLIKGGGGFVSTNSIVYRNSLLDSYPKWAKDAPVGDLPLELFLFHKGRVAYIGSVMSVYRIASLGSWTSLMSNSLSRRLSLCTSLIALWRNFDIWSEKKYHYYIRKRVVKMYKNAFLDIVRCFLSIIRKR